MTVLYQRTKGYGNQVEKANVRIIRSGYHLFVRFLTQIQMVFLGAQESYKD